MNVLIVIDSLLSDGSAVALPIKGRLQSVLDHLKSRIGLLGSPASEQFQSDATSLVIVSALANGL